MYPSPAQLAAQLSAAGAMALEAHGDGAAAVVRALAARGLWAPWVSL